MAFDTNNILLELMKNPNMLKFLQNGNLMNYLTNSEEGKKLMEMLNTDGGNSAQNAASAAAKGDMSGILQIVSMLMSSSEGSEIMNKISQEMNRQK